MSHNESQYILVNFPISKYKSEDFELFKNDLELADPIRSAFGGWMPDSSEYENYYYSSFEFHNREVKTVVMSYLREIPNGTFTEIIKEQIIEGLMDVCKEIDNGAILYLINEADAMIIKDNYIGGKFPVADIENKALFWEMVKMLDYELLATNPD